MIYLEEKIPAIKFYGSSISFPELSHFPGRGNFFEISRNPGNFRFTENNEHLRKKMYIHLV